MKIRLYETSLNESEKALVDSMWSAANNEARRKNVQLAMDDSAERVVDALTLWLIESR